MATYFSIANGLITDLNSFGLALTSAEVTNFTSGINVQTNSLFCPYAVSNGLPLTAVAFNLSSYNVNTSDNFIVDIQTFSNPRFFYDSSSYNLNINVAGTPSQTTFTPYSPSGWCGLFDGTSHISTSSFNLSSLPFTVEGWFWPLAPIQVGTALWGQSNGVGAFPKFTLYVNSLSSLVLDCGSVPSPGLTVSNATTLIKPNNWNHISIVRNSTNINDTFIYINGIVAATGTLAGSLTGVTTTNRFNIGFTGQNEAANKFSGYISNFNILSSASTPDPLSIINPVQAHPSSILLTLHSNRLFDASTNKVITQTNTVSIKDRSPYNSALYDPSIHGGSGLFNGTSDFLSVPTTSALNLKDRNFTIESWIHTRHSTEYTIFGSTNSAGTSMAYNFYVTPGGSTPQFRFHCKYGTGGASTLNQTITLPYVINDASWHHIAVSREGINLRFYLDGRQIGNNVTTLSTFAINDNPFNTYLIGAIQDALTSNFKGYMHGLRVVSNSAVYTGTTYTPPVRVLDSDSSTALLLNYNNIFNSKNSVTFTYPISSLSPYNDNNNLLTAYSLAWQTFKPPTPINTNRGDYIGLSIKSSANNNLSVISSSAACVDITNNFPNPTQTGIEFATDTSGILEGSLLFIPSKNSNITLPSSPLFDFSLGNYTIELWLKPISYPSTSEACRLLAFGSNNTNTSLALKFLGDGTLGVSRSILGSLGINTPVASALTLNQWTHVAIGVEDTFGKIFLNGTLAVSGVITSPAVGNIGLNVGFDSALPAGAAGKYHGYISNLHINNTECLYREGFTIPVQAPTPSGGTGLLLKSSANINRAIITPSNVFSSSLTVAGTLSSSDDSPFGTGVGKSIVFDGTTTAAQSTGLVARTFDKDFTVEAWFKPTNSTVRDEAIIDLRPSASAVPFIISINVSSTSNRVGFYLGTWRNSVSDNVLYGQWNHVAVVRRGTGSNNLIMYVNGLSAYAETNNTAFNFMGGICVGKYFETSVGSTVGRFKGNISNIRVENGVCLYNSNFNPASLSQPIPTLNTAFLFNGADLNSNFPTLMTYTFAPSADVHIVGAITETEKEVTTILADNYCADSNIYIHNNGILRVGDTNKTLLINGLSGIQITPSGQFVIDVENVQPLHFIHNLCINTTIDVHNGGVLLIRGPQKLPYTYLSANSLSATNTFTVVDSVSTQWLSGDSLSFIPNTASKTSFDNLTLSGVETLNTFKTTTTALFNHLALSSVNYIPGVLNLTRNIKIRGFSSTNTYSIRADKGANVLIKNAEFVNLGKTTYGYHGIIFGTDTTGSLNITNNVFNCGNIANIAPINTINTRPTASNLIIDKNIFVNTNETPISLSGISANNVTISNNHILSANNIGLYWRNIIGNNIQMNNNYIAAAKTHGCVVSSCSTTNSIIGGAVAYNSTTLGIVVTGNNVGTIGNVIASHTPVEGVRIDGSSPTLSSVYFYNITALNNNGYGVNVINNTPNLLSSITFNLENSLIQNNLSGGFEGYSITGSIKNVNIINNPIVGMKTSFGNGPLTITNLSSINQSVLDLPVTKVSAMSSFAGPFDPLINDSIYFDGNNDRITLNDTNNILSNVSSTDWTIESWVYLSRMPTTDNTWAGTMSIISTNSDFACVIGSTKMIVSYNGSFISSPANHNLTTSRWYHLTYSRRNNLLYYYVDGVLIGATTVTSTANASTTITIGSRTNPVESRFAGYISNLRVTANTALYYQNIQVPTGPLSATDRTVLLLNPSATKLDPNRIILDSSNYNSTIISTRNRYFGAAQLGVANPFGPTAPCGSVYLSNSSYLQTVLPVPLSSADFTIETWIYPTALNQYSQIFEMGGSATEFRSYLGLRVQDNNNNRPSINARNTGGTPSTFAGLSAIPLNTWSHVALVRQTSAYSLYVNGIFSVSAASQTANNELYQDICIGSNVAATTQISELMQFRGLISCFRIEANTALYTSNFSVPTAPPTPTNNTVLLLNFNNTSYANVSGVNSNIGFTSNTFIDPSVPSNTDASISMNNREGGIDSGEHLLISPTSAYSLSSGDFTVEFYFNLRSYPASNIFLADLRSSNTNDANLLLYIWSSNRNLRYHTAATGDVDTGVNIQLNKWYHIVAMRKNNVAYVIVDGVVRWAAADTNVMTNTDIIFNGSNYFVPDQGAGSARLGGKIHFGSIRVAKQAIYNLNFTPSTTPLTVQSNNTKLLYNLPYGNTIKSCAPTTNIAILSGFNYHPIFIRDSYVGSDNPIYFGTPILLDSTKFNEFSVENSTVSSSIGDITLATSTNRVQGSYLFNNCKFGPILPSITRNNFQPDMIRTAGFAYTTYNQVTGYHLTLLPTGQRLADRTTVSSPAGDFPSERLTPNSNTLLRSGSKFLALNIGNAARVSVDVRKSSTSYPSPDSSTYNGINPRLILKANPAVDIHRDVVLAELIGFNENYTTLTGDTPYVSEDGVLEFYIECNGTQGFINIDNWTINAI